MDNICSSDMGLPKYLRENVFFSTSPFSMLFVIGIINHNPKKITPEREAPVAVWAKHLNNSIKEDQKNILPVPIFDWYHFHIEGPQGVNPLKAPPQTSDLLALMDFTVWELDYSQPKTFFFFKQKKTFMNVRHLQFLRRQALPQCGQVAQSRRRI